MDEKNAGYDTSWFVSEESIKEYICPVCTMVAKDAATTDCNHIFCTSCITGWFVKKKSCPVCGKENPVSMRNTFTDKMILELKVHNRKRKINDDKAELVLREKLSRERQEWCILCCQQVVVEEHKECPGRDKASNKLEPIGVDRKLKIEFNSIVESSSSLSTVYVTLSDIRQGGKSAVLKDKWLEVWIEVQDHGTANAQLAGCLRLDKKALERFRDMHSLRAVSIIRIHHMSGVTDMQPMTGILTRDSIDNGKALLAKRDLRDVANLLMDFEPARLQIVTHYSFTIKPS